MRGLMLALAIPFLSIGAAAQTSPQPWDAVLQQGLEQQAACADRYDKKIIKTATALMKCADNGIYAALLRVGYPDADLVNLMTAQHLVIAERLDKGKITKSEANAQLAELSTQIMTESQRREAARQQAQLDAANAQAQAMATATEQQLQAQALQQQRDQLAAQQDEARRRRMFEFGMQMLQPQHYGPASTNTTCQWIGPQLQCQTQ